MSLRRPKAGDDQLLGQPLLPSRTRRPDRATGRTPLSWLSDANRAMHAGEQPPSSSRMQPPEDQVGYILAVAMVVLGIMLMVLHGKGSPKHPDHWLQLIGVFAALATPAAIFRYANRFITAILVVISAFLISLVKPPDNWIGLYYLVLIGPLAYAFWLTRRQSKAARARAASGGATRSGASGRKGRRNQPAEPEGPVPNRRYTPPKGPRQRVRRSEAAAAPPPPTSRRSRRREAANAKAAARRGGAT